MRITDMEVIPVAHREPRLRNSFGVHSDVEARTLVRLTTADGTTGVGETYGNDAVVGQLEDARSLVEGMDPYDRRRLALRLQRGRGRGESSNAAYAGIETALLDVVGKATGQRVVDLLGGAVRDAVEYSAYLFYKEADPDPEAAAVTPGEVLTPEAMVEEAREFREEFGFETLKLKAGVLEPDEEVRTLLLLAEEFGADVPLRVDPNGLWSVETTVRIARRLREADLTLEFLEDPVPSANAHARLKRRVDYPVATNMFVTAFDDVAPAVELDAVDVVLSDHHYWGGLRANVDLDRVCRTFDLGVGMHSNSHLGVSMAAMTHVGAAMPTMLYAADTHYPWEAEDVIREPLGFEDGRQPVPDGPGLGVELDDDAVERMHERYLEHEPERDDTAAMLERNPDWVPNKPAY
jgi:glucarate dehydratase